jgi:anaerobic magnesium-protoporphyrin IX monomethyl ester cyclase
MSDATAILGKDRIKVLLVRPPCHLWPIVNESDNFLLPLAFPCLGAYLQEHVEGVTVKVIDCLPLRIGWKSLERLIAAEQPDVLGVGDMIVYAEEGMKAISLAKRLNPATVTVAGGHLHSHLPRQSLERHPDLDFIVRFEGEAGFAELLAALRDGRDLQQVRGIAYRANGEPVVTPLRPLIEDLDSLPMPAWDLMPMDLYSPFGMLWHRAITIQGGRGCPYACDFCSWAAMECEHEEHEGRLVTVARHRLKSPERVLEEIGVLYEKYGVRYLFWVDGTWNADLEWLDELCTGILQRGYKLGWWAFVRADLILEQEKAGVLEKMVRAGLRHTLFGGERPSDAGMAEVGKESCAADALMRACHLLEEKYPEVFRQATFITGIRTESRETMEQLGRYSRDCHLDFAAFHPLMPYPGTSLWEKALANNWIEERDFSKFDMFFPVMPSEHLSREKISSLTQKLYQDFVRKQPGRYLRGMFSRHRLRRRLHWWFLFSIGRVLLRDLAQALLGRKEFEGFAAVSRLWKPSWYES